MDTLKPVSAKLRGKESIDGAGVRLRRVFGFIQVPSVDPFLLFDHFGSPNPDDYMNGFPWHPHRGIETVTYMILGEVEHGDSLGNSGVIGSGDLQWMTAGSGIVHKEMPRRCEGFMQGFQLWINLPATHKMMDPRYREIKANTVPAVQTDSGIIKVIAGSYQNAIGPVTDLIVDVEYLDIQLKPDAALSHTVKKNHRAFVYVFEGEAVLYDPPTQAASGSGAVFDIKEGTIKIEAGKNGARFLLVSGNPLEEPISWCGPIVMNTAEECEKAFAEYAEGTFLKTNKVSGI